MIICIETATSKGSVALFKDGQLLGHSELHFNKSHSSNLTVMLQDILSYCKVDLSQLLAVAVSMGPGSYTGLRIGLSTAKGLCYSLDIPLITLPTLKIMSVQVISLFKNMKETNRLYCPMIDARRMEVYTSLYDYKGNEVMKNQAMVIDENSMADYTRENGCFIFGDGAEKCVSVLPSENFTFIEGVYPSAKYMGVLANESFQQQDFADLAYSEPLYLKQYQAKLPKKNKLLQ